MLKKTYKIFEMILTIIITLLFIIIGTCIIQTQILKKDYYNIFGFTMFEVSTGSMSKTIEIGDVIIVDLSKRDYIQENDIIVYKKDEYIITHRLIKIEEDNLTTKGDANNSEDHSINKKDVIGKVVKIIPDVGIWKKVILTPQVLISIIITIVLAGLAFTYEKKDIKEKGKKDV